jgi:hypothetical protein
MTTLACFAAASLLLGMFFRSYAMFALCAIVVVANLASMPVAGVWSASISMILDLIVVQIAYLGGLSVSALLPVSKPASIPTARR